MKQSSFFKNKDFPKEFGGELLRHKRKGMRPLSTKNPLHLVLRADIETSGSLLKYRSLINSTLSRYSKKCDIKIYEQGLAYNHFHVVLRFKNRKNYKSFIRAISGVLAKALKLKWVYRPFTKVIDWGRHFKKACAYALQNELEGLGIIPYQERGRYHPPSG
jgi:hypothetical protein